MIKVMFLRLKTLEQSHWQFNMDRLKVDGHPDLCRDPRSGAIINKNSLDYETYMKTYKTRLGEKERLMNMETDLNELKSEIDEIKDLLRQLISK